MITLTRDNRMRGVKEINVFTHVRNWWSRRSLTLADNEILDYLKINKSGIHSDKLKELSYFTCIKILSEAMSKIPCKLYKDDNGSKEKAKKHRLYQLLTLRPNPNMSASIFFKYVEYQRNDKGNAIIFIDTDKKGKVRGLYPLPWERIEVWVDNAGILGESNDIWYIYKDDNQKEYKMHISEVIHLISGVTTNGITGLSMREQLSLSVENNQAADEYINNYWKEGLQGTGILYYTGEVNKGARDKMKQKIQDMATGLDNAGKLIPIHQDFKYEKFNNDLEGSQFMELKKLSITQIAAAFGIKMHQLNDLDRSTHSNIIEQQKSFYVDTLLAILTAYEQEFNYKLLNDVELERGYEFKFNIDVIMRGNFKEKMTALTDAVNKGVMTANEAREKLDLSHKKEGDSLTCNGNMQKLEDIGAYYKNKKSKKDKKEEK